MTIDTLIFSIFFLAILAIICYLLFTKPKNDMNEQLRNLIHETKGKFFSITFTKKDGEVRTINGKDKYNRLLRGGESKVEGAGYLSAVNRNKEDWFSFKPDSVVTFKCGKIEKSFVVA